MRPQRIVLIGFMGSGKTSVGAEIATRLQWLHLDLDDLIESEDGRQISMIFQESGEDYFRRLEARVTQLVEGETDVVVSTGGGWPTNPYLRARKRSGDLVVWLKTSVDEVLARLAEAGEIRLRPLLEGPDPRATVVELLAHREPTYSSADLTISTDGKSVVEIATEILDNGIEET